MIYITSKREGFARCGVRFSETPTSYPDDRFSPEQLADLENEPMLVVSRDGGGMSAGQAAEQISRLKDALGVAQQELEVVTAERDALYQQFAEMTAECDALREQLAAAAPEDGSAGDTDNKPDDNAGADVDAPAPKAATRAGAKKK
ncbi:TPA: HI1506-related protein [Salmonella enterica subsp. enterica serovar Birkenhead]